MTPAEIQRELDELDTRLERLRIKYDQYFTGTERMLPFVARKDVDRRFHALHREQMRSTGLRFRFQTLVQRFTAYQTYWGRTLRQIEEGTFRRDVLRAQRMGLGTARTRELKELGPDAPGGPNEEDIEEIDEFEALEPEADEPKTAPSLRAPNLSDPPPAARRAPAVPRLENTREPSVVKVLPRADEDFDDLQPPPRAITPPPRAPSTAPVAKPAAFTPMSRPGPLAAKPSAAPPAPGTAARAPMASAPPAPSHRPSAPAEDPGMRQLFDRYLAARKETGESGDVRYDVVAKQVKETLPRLAEKYKDADVRLDVTIKDGKAILRPVVTMHKKP